jgi:hypothetical protein
MAGPLPSLSQYLEQLPDGLESHPGSQAKAVMLHNAIRDSDLSEVHDLLPPPLREAALEPPPISSWIPETHVQGVLLTIHDHAFGGDSEAFLGWTLDGNRRLLSGPLYRILFLVVSPPRLVVGAQHRWHAFHRGSKIVAEHVGNGDARVLLEYPPYLIPPIGQHGFGMAFRAAMESAGGKQISIDPEQLSPTQTRYHIAWT